MRVSASLFRRTKGIRRKIITVTRSSEAHREDNIMSCFTAYIFKTDNDTLLASARKGGSGSLFGQWTSTGNPVVHVIMGKEEARAEGPRLYEAYRLCNIGEWRTAERNDIDGRYRIAQSVYREKVSKQAAPRILILDIGYETGVTPYLYTPFISHTLTQHGELREQHGVMELLNGENPFRRVYRSSSQISSMGYSSLAYPPNAVVSRSQDPERYASAQTHEVDIKPHQWYSNEKDGNDNLQFVMKELKSIAAGEKLDISRDTINHDLTVTFTDRRYRRSLAVKFPSRFPEDGATVSYKIQSSYGAEYWRHTKQPSCRVVRLAMERIVRQIKEKGQIH